MYKLCDHCDQINDDENKKVLSKLPKDGLLSLCLRWYRCSSLFSVSLCINLIFDLNEYYFILTFHLNVWLWMKAPNLLCMLSSYRKCTMKMDRPISQIGVHVLHAVYTLPITQYNLTTVWNFLLPIKFVKLLFHFYMFKRHAFAFMFIVDWP